MKTFRTLSKKALLVLPLLIIATKVFSQNPTGGPQLNYMHYNDSITDACEKTADGHSVKGFQLTAVKGSRIYIDFSANGKAYTDLSLWIAETEEGGQTKKYVCNPHAGVCLGKIQLDTLFETNTVVNVMFTTINPGEKIYFDADVYYGSPEALAFQPDGEFCWKVAYILKNSDNGFKFITKDGQEGYTSKGTSTPMASQAPTESFIHDGMFDIHYESTVARGSKEEMETTYEQAAATLKACLGNQWNYTTTTDEKGYNHISCAALASTKGISIRNISYLGNNMKDNMTKYEIKLYIEERMVQGTKVYELKLTIANLFCQY